MKNFHAFIAEQLLREWEDALAGWCRHHNKQLHMRCLRSECKNKNVKQKKFHAKLQ